MKSRKYPTEADAFTFLRSMGSLQLFGRAGTDYEYMVCTLTIDGTEYKLSVYRDGNVILKE